MAPAARNDKPKRSKAPLYRAAKISDHRFRRVLASFVHDHTVSETAQLTRLSANAVEQIFRKLRVFCFEGRLFMDFYNGQNPLEVSGPRSAHELALIRFHLARTESKRGLKQPLTEPPYHFAESGWRYEYHVLVRERPSGAEAVRAMMLRHLIQFIRAYGPVGARKRDEIAGRFAVLDQIGERARWLQRNAPGFSDRDMRQELQNVIDKIP
ncbi:MAG: hypothetical protein IKE42_15950 [Aquamicrobium sp.]|nr:hypothetical protein [Aquamicrobium sp.]